MEVFETLQEIGKNDGEPLRNIEEIGANLSHKRCFSSTKTNIKLKASRENRGFFVL